MSLPPLASVAALETRLGIDPGSLTGTDLARAGEALADVSTLVRVEAGSDFLSAPIPPAIVTVVLQASLRVYRNPEGLSGEQVGEYSWQQYGKSSPSGVYLSEDEKDVIAKAMRPRRGWTGTVITPSAYHHAPTSYGDLPL
jgi:hypothetical protein